MEPVDNTSKFLGGGVYSSKLEELLPKKKQQYLSDVQKVKELMETNPIQCIKLMIESESFESLNNTDIATIFFSFLTSRQFGYIINIPSFLKLMNPKNSYLTMEALEMFSMSINEIPEEVIFHILHNKFFIDRLSGNILKKAFLKLSELNKNLAEKVIFDLNMHEADERLYLAIYSILIKNKNPKMAEYCLKNKDFFLYCLVNGYTSFIMSFYPNEDLIYFQLVNKEVCKKLIEEAYFLDDEINQEIIDILSLFKNEDNLVSAGLFFRNLMEQDDLVPLLARRINDSKNIKKVVEEVLKSNKILLSNLICRVKEKEWIFKILNDIDYQEVSIDIAGSSEILNNLGNCDEEIVFLLKNKSQYMNIKFLASLLNHIQNQGIILQILEDIRLKEKILSSLRTCKKYNTNYYSTEVMDMLLVYFAVTDELMAPEISYFLKESSDAFLLNFLDNPHFQFDSQVISVYLERKEDILSKKIFEKISNYSNEILLRGNKIDFLLMELYKNPEFHSYFEYYNILLLGSEKFRDFVLDSYDEVQLTNLIKNIELIMGLKQNDDDEFLNFCKQAKNEKFIQRLLKNKLLLEHLTSTTILDKIKRVSTNNDYNDNLAQVFDLIIEIYSKPNQDYKPQKFINHNISLFNYIMEFTDENKVQEYLKKYIQVRSLENEKLVSNWGLTEDEIYYIQSLIKDGNLSSIDLKYVQEAFLKKYIHYADLLKDYIGINNTICLLKKSIPKYQHLLLKEELYQLLKNVNSNEITCLTMKNDFESFWPLLASEDNKGSLSFNDINDFSNEQKIKLLSNPIIFQKMYHVQLDDCNKENLGKLINLFYTQEEITIENLKKYMEIMYQGDWYITRILTNKDLYTRIPEKICNVLDACDETTHLDMEIYLSTKIPELISNIEKILTQYKCDYYAKFLKLCEEYCTLNSKKEKRDFKKYFDYYNAVYISLAEKDFYERKSEKVLSILRFYFKPREKSVLKKFISYYRDTYDLNINLVKKAYSIINQYSNILVDNSEEKIEEMLQFFWNNISDKIILKKYFHIEEPQNIQGYNKRKLERRITNNYLPFFSKKNLDEKKQIIKYLTEDKNDLYFDSDFKRKLEEVKKLVKELNGKIVLKKDELLLEVEYNRENIPTKGEIKEYQNKVKQYDCLKREVNQIFIDYIKKRYHELRACNEITELSYLENSLDFNDENYCFNVKSFFDGHIIDSLLKQCDFSRLFTDEKLYQSIYSLFQNGNFFTIFVLLEHKKLKNIPINQIVTLINNYPFLNYLYKKEYQADLENLNYEKYKNLLNYIDIISNTDSDTLSLIEVENAKKIYYSTEYSATTPGNDKLKIAVELIAKSYLRNGRTIPEVSGVTEDGIAYEMYDYRDPNQLISGIDTDACFKVGGNANDFLSYCILNKNGFILKMADLDGNFVGRVSGFRSGNIIYLNELRSIYDIALNNPQASKRNSRIMRKALKEWAEKVISKLKKDDSIDAVIITESYNCSDCNWKEITSNVNPYELVVTDYDDWGQFLENKNIVTPGLLEDYNDMYIDATDYQLLLVAGNTKFKHKKYDVNINYFPSRQEPQIIYDFDNSEILDKIRKIMIIKSKLDSDYPNEIIDYDNIKMGIVGEDWFVLIDYNDKIETCIINGSKRILKEIQNSVSEYIDDFKDIIRNEYKKVIH